MPPAIAFETAMLFLIGALCAWWAGASIAYLLGGLMGVGAVSYTIAKPQWEFPRLCRGGSKSLTYPAVDTAAPSTKLRMVSRVIDGHERLSHTK
jgi:hypothetical protein